MHNVVLLSTKNRSQPTISTWVKNVYSLCVVGRVTGAETYTDSLTLNLEATQLSAQPSLSTKTVDRFKPVLYTAFFDTFNLLDRRLYTVSTAPTIEKTKKYMKGNY